MSRLAGQVNYEDLRCMDVGGIVEWCDLPEKHYSSSEEDGYMSCNGEAYSSSEEEGYSSSEDEEPEPPSTPDRGFEGSWC